MSTPSVSVVIVSYGTRDLTLAALESVRETKQAVDLEAIVVDNASPDDSADAIAREKSWVKLIRSPENRGFAAGANQGARAAQGEWLLFLNSDARLPAGSLAQLLRIAKELRTPGAVGPWIQRTDGKPQASVGHFYGPWRDFVRSFYLDRVLRRTGLEGLFIPPRRGPVRKVDWVSGACMLIRRDTFQSVEGFDEAYFLYVEDMDLCFRLSKAGWVNYYVPEITVMHELGQSGSSNNPFPLEGGKAPEYFIRKFRPGYPIPLQRSLRVIGILIWMSILQYRILARHDAEAMRHAGLCRATLNTLLRTPD